MKNESTKVTIFERIMTTLCVILSFGMIILTLVIVLIGC